MQAKRRIAAFVAALLASAAIAASAQDAGVREVRVTLNVINEFDILLDAGLYGNYIAVETRVKPGGSEKFTWVLPGVTASSDPWIANPRYRHDFILGGCEFTLYVEVSQGSTVQGRVSPPYAINKELFNNREAADYACGFFMDPIRVFPTGPDGAVAVEFTARAYGSGKYAVYPVPPKS